MHASPEQQLLFGRPGHPGRKTMLVENMGRVPVANSRYQKLIKTKSVEGLPQRNQISEEEEKDSDNNGDQNDEYGYE